MKIYNKYIKNISKVMLTYLSLSVATQVVAQESVMPKDSLMNWEYIYQTNSLSSFDKGLMGVTQGVYSSSNGAPNSTTNIMLRGLNTISLSASPYVLVDGILVKMARTSLNNFASGYLGSNISFLNPLDINSVKVLQSGYNSSMWGGKASNGLISIETNKGSMGTTNIELLTRFGIQTAQYDSYKMMSGNDFRAYLYEYMSNAGYLQTDLAQMNIFNNQHNKYNHNTDWLDITKQDAVFQDYHIKMSGGDGDARYMFGLGYTSQEGTVDPSSYDRFSARINLDYKISPKITMANYLSYSYSNSTFVDQGANWDVHPIYLALTKAPFLSPNYYSDNGIAASRYDGVDELGKSNPALLKQNLAQDGTENKINAIIKGRWEIDNNTGVNLSIIASYLNSTENRVRLSNGIVADEYRIRQNAKRSYSDYILTWNLWADRKGDFMTYGTWQGKLGVRVEQEEEKSAYASRVNAPTDDYETLNSGDLDSLTNIDHEHNILNFYAEAGLRLWDNVNINGRLNAEASSNFGKKGRWNTYGGINVNAGVFKNEDFDITADLQWGRVGNSDIRGYYQYSLYYATKYFSYGGAYFGNSAVTDIKPEITNNYEFGINARLYNRFDIYAGYYYKYTTNLLSSKSSPIELGLDDQFENNGEVLNTGIEVSINANVINNDKMKWNVFANVSTLKNEVKSLNNGDIITSYDKFNSIARKGEAIGSFYGYKIQGIYNTQADVNLRRADGTNYLAGDYKMEDLNGDGIINKDDMQVLGSPLPKFFGGFGTNISYKGFKLEAIFSYSYGNDVYNLFKQRLSSMSDLSVPVVEAGERWISESAQGSGNLARASLNDPSGNFNASNKWVEDGSYIKLKTLSLSYDIPLNNTKFVRGLKVFANCNNLFTLSSYSGYDPEVYLSPSSMLRGVDTGGMPNPQSFVFGLNLSL